MATLQRRPRLILAWKYARWKSLSASKFERNRSRCATNCEEFYRGPRNERQRRQRLGFRFPDRVSAGPDLVRAFEHLYRGKVAHFRGGRGGTRRVSKDISRVQKSGGLIAWLFHGRHGHHSGAIRVRLHREQVHKNAYTIPAEPVRANMGGERVRHIQEDDDTEEPGAAAASFEHDRAEVRPHARLLHVRRRDERRRFFGNGRNHSKTRAGQRLGRGSRFIVGNVADQRTRTPRGEIQQRENVAGRSFEGVAGRSFEGVAGRSFEGVAGRKGNAVVFEGRPGGRIGTRGKRSRSRSRDSRRGGRQRRERGGTKKRGRKGSHGQVPSGSSSSSTHRGTETRGPRCIGRGDEEEAGLSESQARQVGGSEEGSEEPATGNESVEAEFRENRGGGYDKGRTGIEITGTIGAVHPASSQSARGSPPSRGGAQANQIINPVDSLTRNETMFDIVAKARRFSTGSNFCPSSQFFFLFPWHL